MISVVTTTRNRALCFSLLCKWLSRQTYRGEWQHVIVNDGTEQYEYLPGQKVINRIPQENEGFSLCQNWVASLPYIKDSSKVIICEDDDFYHETYLETMVNLLDQADLVGVHQDLYYNLRTRRFRRCHNLDHCSLAATAMTRKTLPFLEILARANETNWLDMLIWEHVPDTAIDAMPAIKKLSIPNKARDGLPLHIGFKGMPGAAGLGKGHDGLGSTDNGFAVLRQWLGIEAARLYMGINKWD